MSACWSTSKACHDSSARWRTSCSRISSRFHFCRFRSWPNFLGLRTQRWSVFVSESLVETLREELQSHSAGQGAEAGDVRRGDPLNAVGELEQHNIRRTIELIDRKAFEEVASMLFRADHIFIFGLGISAYLSDFASYLFTEHGLRATSFGTRFSSPREQLVVLRPTDLVLGFSFPPYSRQTLEVLEEARERGARTVAITDRPSAPAVALAERSLTVSSHGMMFNNSTAAVDVLLNALLVQIASQHRGETVEALSRINRILRDQSYLIDESD